MNKPNLIGSKLIFNDPTRTGLTNAIVDAVDSSTTSSGIWPHAYTAAVSGQYDTHNWTTVATDIDLAAASKFAMGVFLSDQAAPLGGAVLFSCKGSLTFLGEASSEFLVYPFFGRLSSSAVVVQSDSAASNELASYIILPQIGTFRSASTAAVSFNYCHVDQEVLQIASTIGNPLCFGFVILNASATAWNIDMLNCTLSIQKYVNDLPGYNPSGR